MVVFTESHSLDQMGLVRTNPCLFTACKPDLKKPCEDVPFASQTWLWDSRLQVTQGEASRPRFPKQELALVNVYVTCLSKLSRPSKQCEHWALLTHVQLGGDRTEW